jgi:hypothetical protein
LLTRLGFAADVEGRARRPQQVDGVAPDPEDVVSEANVIARE